MKLISAFSCLPLLLTLLLVGGCASVPSERLDESSTTSAPSGQEIGISEPEKEERLFLHDEMSDMESDGAAAPAAREEGVLRNKPEKRGDDMERLD